MQSISNANNGRRILMRQLLHGIANPYFALVCVRPQGWPGLCNSCCLLEHHSMHLLYNMEQVLVLSVSTKIQFQSTAVVLLGPQLLTRHRITQRGDVSIQAKHGSNASSACSACSACSAWPQCKISMAAMQAQHAHHGSSVSSACSAWQQCRLSMLSMTIV